MGGGHHGPMAGIRATQKAKDFNGSLKRLLKYLSPYKLRLIIVFLTAILSTVFSIYSPKVLGKATTRLFQGVVMKKMNIPGAFIDLEYIAQIAVILLVLYVVSSLFNYLQQYLMAEVSQKTVYDMRREAENKLGRMPLKYFDAHSHGDVLSRFTNDMDNISSTLQQSLTQLITSIVTIVGILIMMLTISPLMTLIALVVLPVSMFVIKPILKKAQGFFIGQQIKLGQLNGHIEEMYTGHNVVKAFGHEEKSIKEFKVINEQLYEVGWKAQFISGLMMPVMMFINNIAYVTVCVVGGFLATKKKLEVGDIQAFIQYMRSFSQPINQTANIANIIQSTVASAERVFEILDEKEEIPDSKDAVVMTDCEGNVQFDHVKFGYTENNTLIHDMNIDVKKGHTIAIVGPTGAGKTTLINLLMRFYEVDDGRILIDGIDIRDMTRESLRNTFGMVLQDTWSFKGTIKENIAYGRMGATDEEIIEAAKAAHADHFIRTLEHGYDTELNEEASNISQGQKQLLTIARAILADPKILILDEATSSVDTRTEVAIQKAMDKLMHGRTSFVIAHRLSTIKDADLILVMNHGNVIEQGTHKELLAQKGFYADLYNSQFAGKAI
ncbi:MAG: ABC transporter ATP-binding protein [Inconstantimicrobium porci]|nr:ABC transporter ATP-binding protein [Inconstantimicrobium porci]MDD6770571.1 ABC transporter ATP-binding protein [Inconstantimicrobium porci]MDY5911092.1 ABC transporter ATP-binding protein [Inconstantimicrobium porci]